MPSRRYRAAGRFRTARLEHRLRLTGVYFDLTDRFAPTPAARGRLPEGGPADGHFGTAGTKVLISVAKRLVPSAVRRNTVKRIVREAWRAAVRNAASMEVPDGQPAARETSSGSAIQDLKSVQGKERSGLEPHGETSSRVCLVRLKRYPGSDLKTEAGRTGAGKAGARQTGARQPGAAPPVKSGIATTRRILRADVDALFAAFMSEASPRRRRRSPGAFGNDRPRDAGA